MRQCLSFGSSHCEIIHFHVFKFSNGRQEYFFKFRVLISKLIDDDKLERSSRAVLQLTFFQVYVQGRYELFRLDPFYCEQLPMHLKAEAFPTIFQRDWGCFISHGAITCRGGRFICIYCFLRVKGADFGTTALSLIAQVGGEQRRRQVSMTAPCRSHSDRLFCYKLQFTSGKQFSSFSLFSTLLLKNCVQKVSRAVLRYKDISMFFNSESNDGQKVIDREGNLGEVWISGYNFAHDVPKLKKYDLKAICSGVELGFKYPEDFKHLTFDLEDSHEQDARMTFKPAFQFIENARKQTNVLVHCAAGISRSSTLLIAYMLQKYKMPYENCLRKVQSCRSCCQPNMGFVKQLKQLEKSLGIVPEK